MLKYFKNIFLLIFTAFALWMLFFDSNSLLIHNELNNEIKAIENEKEYYRKEIAKDNKAIKELKKEEGLEKFAREEYYMKRDNEDIYIIEYQDSTKAEN
ncbi:septum formation initiator family protein [Lacinutrix sp. MedPE-SW]|uniref:FtsB family cell division protein n=1 Tax=Lacinutrix sp. MedPE-SW TaxID=1860087 RepID=UPI000923AD1B|nr:septum formation initiator family protein [Lacinutrix sp. MedPE-SW]OIQ23023.1 MAG: septum formation initiator [Lacinutrix sp. MedPE-SW]